MSPSPTRRFFEDMLPQAFGENRALFEASRGSICIVVEPEGAWTIRFGRYGAPECYVEEVDEEADCVMVWPVQGFERMLLSQPLSEEDEPKCYGEERMIEVFTRFMRPPAKGPLGIMSRR